MRWIDGNQIVCDHLYIVEDIKTCFRCKKETRVIGFGFEHFYDPFDYNRGVIHIGNIVSDLPNKLRDELKNRYNYYWGYSYTTESYSYGNHCQNKSCGVLQGNWFAFSEADSPFFIYGPDTAKKLVLRRIPLKQDVVMTAVVAYGDMDHNIKEYAKILDSDLRWA